MRPLFLALLLGGLLAFATSASFAAERKAAKEIDHAAFARDTQLMHTGQLDNSESYIGFAWFVPLEYWETILANDQVTPQAAKDQMLEAMADVALLAVAQADVAPTGHFDYYSREEILEKMIISVKDADGRRRRLTPIDEINPTTSRVVNGFKPVLSAAMGAMGQNLHFFVLDVREDDGTRLANPLKEGTFDLRLVRRDGENMDGQLTFPINALFVPRKCPNGKDAHISWKFCPWTGVPLED